mmetsp:Transcript_7936/g.15390  ORF Transcript_7936/g.15390 Transcript_7936/m.15390 type:complete len:209 (+) Transcript_7936:892-1518(+)
MCRSRTCIRRHPGDHRCSVRSPSRTSCRACRTSGSTTPGDTYRKCHPSSAPWPRSGSTRTSHCRCAHRSTCRSGCRRCRSWACTGRCRPRRTSRARTCTSPSRSGPMSTCRGRGTCCWRRRGTPAHTSRSSTRGRTRTAQCRGPRRRTGHGPRTRPRCVGGTPFRRPRRRSRCCTCSSPGQRSGRHRCRCTGCRGDQGSASRTWDRSS